MLRSKKLVLVTHCILNQNSVVEPLARAKGPFKIVKMLVDEGIGLIQLPCPELRFLGITRKPMEKNEYDTNEYRALCRELFTPILQELLVYKDSGYEIMGIIAINGSPSCSIAGDRGIYMEEIYEMLKASNLELQHVEIPTDYDDERDYTIINSIIKQVLMG
jgi:predicted secreted protein